MKTNILEHKLLLLSILLCLIVSFNGCSNDDDTFRCSYSRYTCIPDTNFEQSLINSGIDTDGIINGRVLTSDVSGITELELWSRNIRDLTGIEDFVSLTELKISMNELTSLDLSNNKSLTRLNCEENQLTSLDISNNTSLEYFTCYKNQLTSLDVSNNTSLTFLWCVGNQLTSLDVSKNTSLIELACSSNQLTSLDVSNNTSLIELSCGSNQLTSLNISKNTSLEELWCYNNQLTSLDVSNNTSLEDLRCFENQLTSLNVKNGYNSLITTFYANNNPDLTCIQVDNEADATASTGTYSTWQKDASATYSEDCGY